MNRSVCIVNQSAVPINSPEKYKGRQSVTESLRLTGNGKEWGIAPKLD